METIPSHNYYKDPRHAEEKRRLKANSLACLGKLEALVAAMDGDCALLDE